MMTGKTGKRLNEYAGNYVVFDLETTGFSPVKDEIIEISALRVRNGEVKEEFTTLVNPNMPIPRAASRVNSITDEMVEDAPQLSEALAAFWDFAGEDVLVGHNIHSFDLPFLYEGAKKAFCRQMHNNYVDTLYFARTCMPQLGHYKLTDISEQFGIATTGAHRALADCYMNQKCYERLLEIWQKKQEERQQKEGEEEPCCPQCGCILIKRKGKFGFFWGCSGFPDCRYTKNCRQC